MGATLTVTGLDLCVNLDTAICRNHVVGNRDALMDRDALVDDSVVLHVTHTKHAVNLRDTKPVQNVGHKRLEAHIFDTSNVLCSLEIFARSVFAALAGIVNEVLGDFAKCSALFAEIDDNTTATVLSFLDSFLDTESKVWATCADVGSKYVTAVAFIVNTKCEFGVWIRHLRWVAEDVDSETSNGRKEYLDVVPSDEFRIGAASLLEQRASECSLI